MIRRERRIRTRIGTRHQRLVCLYNNPKPQPIFPFVIQKLYWFQFLVGYFDLQDALTIQGKALVISMRSSILGAFMQTKNNSKIV